MSESSLSFASSSSFRNTLIARNLAPYNVPGAYTAPAGDVVYEATPLSDNSVIDSPNDLVGTTAQANELYPLNEYGPEGGYSVIINTNNPPLPVESNQGEYGYEDSDLELINEFYIDAAYVKNAFGPEAGYKDMVIVTDVTPGYQYFLPYYDLNPLVFIPSQYTPFEIITSNTPQGSDGPLSQDSFLAKIGANSLKFAFEERIAYEEQQILNSIVNLDSLQDPFEASLVATGQQPLIGKNWKITVPENPLLAGVNLLNRITGTYFPVSFIPGDYFDETNQVLSPQTENALNVVNNLTGGLLGPILNKYRNPSELFLANTGYGQKSVLFKSLDYNKYRPSYNKGLLLGVTTAINNLLGNNTTQGGGFYVGDEKTDPSRVDSPDNEIPVDAYGKQQPSPVYGPSELGKLYEGNDTKIKFGLAGKSYSDQGGITGQFTWVSPKYKDNLGFKVKPGGDPTKQDEEFFEVKNEFNDDTESTGFEFKQGSILDNTQRLVDSADSVTGIRRLQHVGNAINQVSKVFNDGYKEMTKGSRVVSYTDNTSGAEAGIEYCRVFQKDTPYLTYADLQKTDGITTAGRRFNNSVLDNTFNLNIAPLRNPGSTNIVDGKVKKYMFSLENLAWRTSDRPGFTYQDLRDCEKGPNGGRTMWFPPYDLSFSESSRATWNPTSFLGRPEPIYTYKETTRGGSISWKIIVDHPSAMNTIIEKQLANVPPERIDSIMDSFFAGCVKYDLYELAAKFNRIPTDKLYTYQQILQNPGSTDEEIKLVNQEIVGNTGGQGTNGSNSTSDGSKNGDNQTTETFTSKVSDVTQDTFGNDLNKFIGYGFYFDNDYPIGQTSFETNLNSSFQFWYDQYISGKTTDYVSKAPAKVISDGKEYTSSGVAPFFNKVVEGNFNAIKTEFLPKLKELLVDYQGKVTIELTGSASAPAKEVYNKKLSQRRNSVVENWFKDQTIGDKKISEWIEGGQVKFSFSSLGEETVIPNTSGDPSITNVVCTADIQDASTNKVTSLSQWYSVPAMACRRVAITKINIDSFTPPPVDIEVVEVPVVNPIVPVDNRRFNCVDGNCIEVTSPNDPAQFTGETNCRNACGKENIEAPKPTPTPKPTIDKKIKDGISKQVLRTLFSECDYFEVIKETNPMVYSSFKDKIKFFNPAFHSMTPEGLNARLTFLQQCVRPGQTIPVIGPDGKPKYNDARNTSFGAPPVLVLRIGDFFHSKIIPNDLQISYEPLLYDINPEGIGVQPMIAKISLGFDFIGGQGLANPVQQLQNALSFNFYANTEIYDERSIPTESTKDKDEALVQKVLNNNPGLGANTGDIQNLIPERGGSTIGTILSTSNFNDGEYQAGQIEYTKLFENLSTSTNTYFTTIFNQLKSINNVRNYPTLQILSKTRNYSKGNLPEKENEQKIPPIEVEILGKMTQYEDLVTDLIKQTIKDIEDDNCPLVRPIATDEYSKQTKREYKNKLIELVSEQENKILDDTIGFINELTNYQQNYVQIFKDLDLVIGNVIDGYKLETGKYKVYNLDNVLNQSKQQELQKIYPDKIVTNLNGYFKTINDKKILNNNFVNDSNFTFVPLDYGVLLDDADLRFYFVMSNIFTDDSKYNTFVESIITERVKLNTTMENTIKETCASVKTEHIKEFDAEKKLFTDFETSPEYQKFVNFKIDKPESKLEYSTKENENTKAKANQKLLKEAYSDLNTNKKKNTFNGKVVFD
jgi:hypothetical protein